MYSDGGIDISKDGRYLLTCARVQIPPISLSELNAMQKSSSVLSPSSPSGPPSGAFNYGKSHSPEPSEANLPPLFNAPMRGAERSTVTGSSPTQGQSSVPKSRTPPPPSTLSFATLRNSMSAMSGLTGLTASSSGDFLSVQSGNSSSAPSGGQSPLPPAPGTPVVSAGGVSLSPPPPPDAQSDGNVAVLLDQLTLSGGRQRDADGTPLVIDMTAKRNSSVAFETPNKYPTEGTVSGGGNSAVHSYNSLNLEHSTYKSYIRDASTRKIYQGKLQKLMSRAGQVRGELCVYVGIVDAWLL